jgi:hypothetical protein
MILPCILVTRQFTSRPTSLLTSIKVSLFFLYGIYVITRYFHLIISASVQLIKHNSRDLRFELYVQYYIGLCLLLTCLLPRLHFWSYSRRHFVLPKCRWTSMWLRISWDNILYITSARFANLKLWVASLHRRYIPAKSVILDVSVSNWTFSFGNLVWIQTHQLEFRGNKNARLCFHSHFLSPFLFPSSQF